MLRRTFVSIVSLLVFWGALPLAAWTKDAKLAGAFRRPEQNGWIYVHLQGKPSVVGYQHGYLLAPEIEDNKRAIELSTTHETGKTWDELRAISKKIFWPGVPGEYRQELAGIASGLHARGGKLDVIDLVTMNAYMEFDYYLNDLKRRTGSQTAHATAEHCSAFIATGNYTKDGKIVIGHNN